MTGDDCRVCRHRRRDDVDAEPREGRQSRQIARRHRLDPADLQRHQDEHQEPAEPVERRPADPRHGAAFMEAWRRRAAEEGVYVPTSARRWRDRAPGWAGPPEFRTPDGAA